MTAPQNLTHAVWYFIVCCISTRISTLILKNKVIYFAEILSESSGHIKIEAERRKSKAVVRRYPARVGFWLDRLCRARPPQCVFLEPIFEFDSSLSIKLLLWGSLCIVDGGNCSEQQFYRPRSLLSSFLCEGSLGGFCQRLIQESFTQVCPTLTRTFRISLCISIGVNSSNYGVAKSLTLDWPGCRLFSESCWYLAKRAKVAGISEITSYLVLRLNRSITLAAELLATFRKNGRHQVEIESPWRPCHVSIHHPGISSLHSTNQLCYKSQGSFQKSHINNSRKLQSLKIPETHCCNPLNPSTNSRNS